MSVCFEVDTDVLRRDTLTLRQYLSIISHAHGNLRDKMMEVNGMWEGPAKEAFHAQFKEDCAELINLCKQIRDVLESMEDAAKEYDSCDGSVKSIIDSIHI